MRIFAHRFAFVLLVLGAFGLMLLGKADTVVVERVRTVVSDAITPVMDVLSRPATIVSDFVSNTRELVNLRQENARLREQNTQLLKWQAIAENLESENDRLKALQRFIDVPEQSFITARVVADTGAAFVHSLILTAGATEGVRKGQAVLSGFGLAGRITEVGQRSSRVLLLTDINSRIPVVVGEQRLRAILVGENADRAKLLFIASNSQPEMGARVVTSGHAGAFPPGLPVGVVTSIDEAGTRVLPFMRRHQLEEVRVVEYGLTGILEKDNLR